MSASIPTTSIPGPAGSGGGMLSKIMRSSRGLMLAVGGLFVVVVLALAGWWYMGDQSQPRVVRQYPSPNYRYECQVVYAPGSYWGGTQDRFTFSIHQLGNSLALNGTERTFTAAKMPAIEVMWLTNSDVRALAGGTTQPAFLGRIEQDGSQSWRPDVAPEPAPAPKAEPVQTPAPVKPAPAAAPAPTPLEKPAADEPVIPVAPPVSTNGAPGAS